MEVPSEPYLCTSANSVVSFQSLHCAAVGSGVTADLRASTWLACFRNQDFPGRRDSDAV